MRRGLILPFELALRGINRVRRSLYETGVLGQQSLPRPVISIGNISLGGSGKTPTVIAVARGLMKRGLRVAVLTRGYGSAVRDIEEVVSSFDAARYGDEPIVIAKALPGVPVIVGRRRFQAAGRFLESSDCDVFILDDGFQHLQLCRNVDVVLVRPDSRDLLREGPSALRSADMTIARVRDRGEIAFADLRPAESFSGLLEPVDLTLDDSILPLEKLRSARVFAFSGLADNQQFFDMLRTTGADVVRSEGFRDHHRYSSQEVERLKKAAEASGAAFMVTTEKDAVKIADPSIATLRVQMSIIPEEAFFRELIEKLGSVIPISPESKRRKRQKSGLLQRVEYTLFRAAGGYLRARPPEAIHRWGDRLGSVAYKLVNRRTRLALRNVQRTFPEKSPEECREIVRACWKHFAWMGLDHLRTARMSLEEIVERCDVYNRDELDRAVAVGRGVVLISAHFGNWELGGNLLMTVGPPVAIVARPLDNALLQRDLAQSRIRPNVELVDRRRAARALIKVMGRQGIAVLLTDQAVKPREGILIPFLGRPAWTTPSPARIALRFNAPIAFVFCVPDGDRCRVEFQESIFVDQLPEAERTVEAITTRINEIVAERIRQQPHLWLWMHDRWKGTGS